MADDEQGKLGVGLLKSSARIAISCQSLMMYLIFAAPLLSDVNDTPARRQLASGNLLWK